MKYKLQIVIHEFIDLPLTEETKDKAGKERIYDSYSIVDPIEIVDPIIRELVEEKKQTRISISFYLEVHIPFPPQLGLQIEKDGLTLELKNLKYNMTTAAFESEVEVYSQNLDLPHLTLVDYIRNALKKGFTDFNCYKKDFIRQQLLQD